MLRRISIALCALWLLLGVSALQAQTAKNQRIGILAASAAAASEPNMEALRRRLAASLPMTLRPAKLTVLPQLPSLPTGKTDGNALARFATSPAGPEDG